MHVENGLQNTRSDGELEKTKALAGVDVSKYLEKMKKMLQKQDNTASQGKSQKATNPVNKNAGSVLKAPTKPSADKPNNIQR